MKNAVMDNIFCSMCAFPLKKAADFALRERLAGELINLSCVALSVTCDKTMTETLLEGLAILDDNIVPEPASFVSKINRTVKVRNSHGYTCFFQSHDIEPFDMDDFKLGDESSALKSFILSALCAMAAYSAPWRKRVISDAEVTDFFYKGLTSLSGTLTAENLADIALELGLANLRCMELADFDTQAAYETAVYFAEKIQGGELKNIIIGGGCCAEKVSPPAFSEELLTFGCCAEDSPTQTYLGSGYMAVKFIQFLSTVLKLPVALLPVEIIYPLYASRSAALLLTFLSIGVKKIYIAESSYFQQKETFGLLKSRFGLKDAGFL